MIDARDQTVSWRPGRVTVFSVCAYWCDTWRLQVPRLLASQSALGGLPVDLVTISTDGRWSDVARNNAGLPLWRDLGAEWSHQVGIDRVPTTVVVDETGTVRFVKTGVVREGELVPAVRSALVAESGAGAGEVYLTFDDFPPAAGGEALLDALRACSAPATLFCICDRLESNTNLIRRAQREGLSVQCHSWDHQAADPQLDRCRDAFEAVLGHPFTLYRAPGSEKIVGLDRKIGVVDPYDFTRPGRTEILRRVLAAVRPGCEIQLHAGVSETLDGLPELIRRLRDRGFRLAVLGSSN